ncbi:MAG: hypothetical protein ACC663_02410 [Gammaproteobacteria bacterium]
MLGNLLARWFTQWLDLETTPANEAMLRNIIIASMIAYTILIAIPFVPGVEIGLAVIMILGSKIIALVYLCTLAGLSFSFMVGRYMPERALISLLRGIHLDKASNLLASLEGLDSQSRLKTMLENSPRKFLPALLKHRYIALMVAINLPGNTVIGGGGGISLMAGLCRLFHPPIFFLAIAVAVSPVPIAWLVFGENFSEWLY